MNPPVARRTANLDRWGPVSQGLHWIIVALILVMAYLGLTMTELPNGPHKVHVYGLHKSIGLTILALVSLRLSWRLYAGAPPVVAGTPRWQARVAVATHTALYVLLFAIPLSGWVVNSSAGFPLQWFGLFNLPHLMRRDASVHAVATEVHEALFWCLAALAVVHAAAALYHHFVRRDPTLARMLPRGWLRLPHGES